MKGFETTYKAYYTVMFAVAMKMLLDAEAARDIIQDVFLSYYESGSKGRTVTNPKGYLTRATLNKCIDYRVRKNKMDSVENQNLNLASEDDEKADQKEIISGAMAALNDEERKIAVLYSEGYSYKEISDIAGINLNSVGKKVSRVLLKLKVALKILDYELSKR